MATDRDIEMIRAALQEATSASRTAEASANALALTINGNGVDDDGLRGDIAEHTGEIKRLERGRRVNRKIAVIALVIVLVFGVAYWRFRSYQDCVNRQNDERAQSSVEFFSHVKGWAAGQKNALDSLIADPTTKAESTAAFLGAYGSFIDYADRRIAQLSGPAKGC